MLSTSDKNIDNSFVVVLQLVSNYSSRSSQIKKCIHGSAEQIRVLKINYENDENNIDILKKLKKEQNKVSFFSIDFLEKLKID